MMEIIENIVLDGAPYFDNDKFWTSPFNFQAEIQASLPKRVYIHDVTLRDGEQTPGVVFRQEERVRIATALSELGVQRIEAGMPIVSKEVAQAVAKLAKMNLGAEIVAFARAHPDDINLCVDCGVKAIIVEHTVNPYLCRYVYGLDTEAMIGRIVRSIALAKEKGLHTTFMGWDFFRANLDYCRRVYTRIIDESRPDVLALTDTYGVATPMAIWHTFRSFKEWFPDVPLEFHGHNDFGLANGCVVAAVYGGAVGIHCSVNGLGERTGNAATEQVVAALEMLLGVDTGIDLKGLKYVSDLIAEISKVPIPWRNPIVGEAMFRIESGVGTHMVTKLRDAGIKPVRVFLPEVVGQRGIEFVLGFGSGRTTIKHWLDRFQLAATDEEIAEILRLVKEEALVRKNCVPEEAFLRIAKEVTGKNP